MGLLQQLIKDEPEWYDEAQCRGTSPEIFFPTDVKNGNAASTAKYICSLCTVKPQCLTYALDTKQSDGIWGGKTPKERKRIRH